VQAQDVRELVGSAVQLAVREVPTVADDSRGSGVGSGLLFEELVNTVIVSGRDAHTPNVTRVEAAEGWSQEIPRTAEGIATVRLPEFP
jgi:hypothetical protein